MNGVCTQAKLLPCEEGFDPEAYLAIFHEKSSSAELASGLRALERELGERTGQLKQLVRGSTLTSLRLGAVCQTARRGGETCNAHATPVHKHHT